MNGVYLGFTLLLLNLYHACRIMFCGESIFNKVSPPRILHNVCLQESKIYIDFIYIHTFLKIYFQKQKYF
jgi:hypothetical protein